MNNNRRKDSNSETRSNRRPSNSVPEQNNRKNTGATTESNNYRNFGERSEQNTFNTLDVYRSNLSYKNGANSREDPYNNGKNNIDSSSNDSYSLNVINPSRAQQGPIIYPVIQVVDPIPQEIISTQQEITSVPQTVDPIPQEIISTQQEITSVPQTVDPIPQEIISVPQTVDPVPQEIISTPQEIISTPQEITSIQQEIISTPQEMISPPQADNSIWNVPDTISGIFPNGLLPKEDFAALLSQGKIFITNSSQQVRPPPPLMHYHINGGCGWQRISGYSCGTDIQPLQIIKNGSIYGIAFSNSGLSSTITGSIFIYKNAKGVPKQDDCMGEIIITGSLTEPTNFTILPDEEIKVFDTVIARWRSTTVEVSRNDRLSFYAEDLSGCNLEIFLE